VVAAVHHAEVVAHRVGEPFGTLVLAVAITVIEVALILSMMLAGGPGTATLPRDTIYAAVMIICNGVVGICLLAAACATASRPSASKAPAPAWRRWWRWRGWSLVLPTFTTSSSKAPTPCRSWCSWRPVVAGAVGGVRVRADGAAPRLLPAAGERRPTRTCMPRHRPPCPGLASLGLLLVALVSPWWAWPSCCRRASRPRWRARRRPRPVVGIVIAMLVLLPETWAAVRAARPTGCRPA
jgi:Ca2+:H+ antiporter